MDLVAPDCGDLHHRCRCRQLRRAIPCVPSTSVTVHGICNGDCPSDVDGASGLTMPPVCNGPDILQFRPQATDEGDCDCNGNQLDALGICGGPVKSDADGDGICDDVDPCTYPEALDSCGVWTMEPTPSATVAAPPMIVDCDCDGHDLIVVGECGRACRFRMSMRMESVQPATSTN